MVESLVKGFARSIVLAFAIVSYYVMRDWVNTDEALAATISVLMWVPAMIEIDSDDWNG